MKDILIKSTINADTRSGSDFNPGVVLKSTIDHIDAVEAAMISISDELITMARKHDHSKVNNIHEFAKALEGHKNDPENKHIKKSDWWQKHRMERHHLNDRVPEDVNLFDVLEMIVDGVVAGKARTGDVYPIELSNDILQKALLNTQKLLIDSVKVDE